MSRASTARLITRIDANSRSRLTAASAFWKPTMRSSIRRRSGRTVLRSSGRSRNTSWRIATTSPMPSRLPCTCADGASAQSRHIDDTAIR
ncbi:hypothetical protein D9M70_415500 [compost metagenome]